MAFGKRITIQENGKRLTFQANGTRQLIVRSAGGAQFVGSCNYITLQALAEQVWFKTMWEV